MSQSAYLEKLLNEDVENIYLGNLKTVDADIEMPQKGENGTVFSWQSNKPKLLSAEGKVCRPHFGAGNREVILTLTATLGDLSLTKEFIANVLEKEYPTTVISAYPLTICTQQGNLLHLPGVAVIRNNLGEDAMIPVKWPEISADKVMAEGSFVVEGKVKDDVTVVATIVVTNDEEQLCPMLNKQKKAEKFNIKDVSLKEGSSFYNQQQRVMQNLLAFATFYKCALFKIQNLMSNTLCLL